jgi:hypothetical protein
MPAISLAAFFPVIKNGRSRLKLADFGRWSAYLIDSAGRNPVCVAQLFAANESLIATVEGRQVGSSRFSVLGHQLRLGARSPSKDDLAAAIDRETGGSGGQ